MEEYNQYIKLQTSKTLTQDEIKACNLLVNPAQGILNLTCIDMIISLEYSPFLISEKDIKTKIEKLGIEISVPKVEKGFLKSWAEKNKENLGNQRLDCCTMNYKMKGL